MKYVPKTRRPHGAGSIYQRQNGTWAGVIDLGWAEGGRKRRTFYAKTREEVEQTLARIMARPADERAALVNRQNAEIDRDLAAADRIATHTVEAWIAKRDAIGCCVYCGATGALTQDHVIPITRGGDNSLANVVPCCQRCNVAKGADTAYEFIRRQLLT